MVVLRIIIEAVITILAVDLVSGLVHWMEDTFWDEHTPVFGKWLVKPNVIHHVQPNAFTVNNWWQSSWDLLLASALIVVVAWVTGHLTWHVWLFSFIGANANQLHKYAHMSSSRSPWVVRTLQKAKILQTAKHHALHHTGDKNMAYCVVTPYLNPVLDRIGFWRGLEAITVPLFGAPRRDDIKMK